MNVVNGALVFFLNLSRELNNHIQMNSAGFTNGQVVSFNVQIGCFAVRDKISETVEDKFWLQDNEVDNMNET